MSRYYKLLDAIGKVEDVHLRNEIFARLSLIIEHLLYKLSTLQDDLKGLEVSLNGKDK